MVNAKLYVICGNCGNDIFRHDKENYYLLCEDCATVHSLEDIKKEVVKI